MIMHTMKNAPCKPCQLQLQLQLFNNTTRRLGDSPLCCRDQDRRRGREGGAPHGG